MEKSKNNTRKISRKRECRNIYSSKNTHNEKYDEISM